MHPVTVAILVIAAVYALSITSLATLFGRALWRERGLPLPDRMELSATGVCPAVTATEPVTETSINADAAAAALLADGLAS